MVELVHGQVVLYSYLWWREHQRGEETGRKTRPACVMIVLTQRGGGRRAVLFPITSSRPSRDTAAIEIPETEARRAKLYSPAWVIVNEFNSDDPDNSLAVEAAEPLGSFSKRFVGQIAAAAAKAARASGLRAVSRE